MKKELIVILLKVVVYACGLLLAYFGISTLSSCSLSRQSTSDGKCTIIVSDTTIIRHGANKSFNPF